MNKVTSTGVHGLRVKVVTYSAAYEKPIAGYRDIEDLIRQCIVVASDGKPAIRVVLTEKANGAGLSNGAIAGAANQNDELFGLMFCTATDGGIAIQIYSIT